MKSKALGRNTLEAEVTHISKHGFWLLLNEEEFFLSFEKFPWFKDASISAILHIEWLQPHHLYWPELDADLAVESIKHPDKYPLIAKFKT